MMGDEAVMTTSRVYQNRVKPVLATVAVVVGLVSAGSGAVCALKAHGMRGGGDVETGVEKDSEAVPLTARMRTSSVCPMTCALLGELGQRLASWLAPVQLWELAHIGYVFE